MKINQLIVSALIMVTALSLTSCGNDDKTTDQPTAVSTEESTPEQVPLNTGVVTETGFESEWLNLKLDFPTDWFVLDQDDILEKMGQSTKDLALEYSFIATDRLGSINLQLAYDDLIESDTLDITEEEYLENEQDNNEELGLEIVEEGKKDIADKTYTYVKKHNSEDGYLITKYVCKVDGYMVNLVFTYVEPQESLHQDIVNSITTLN